MMLKQTKIVASISDQRCEVEFYKRSFQGRYECGPYEYGSRFT